MGIPERIKEERLKRNLTQQNVSDKMGEKRTTYANWEKKTPDLETLRRIEEALDLPAGYFTSLDTLWTTQEKIALETKIKGMEITLDVLLHEVALIRSSQSGIPFQKVLQQLQKAGEDKL